MKGYVAGIDVGSRMTRCVIMDRDERILARTATITGAFLAQAAETAFQKALDEAGLTRDDIIYVASTGWGRYQVPFRDIQITDITCHARGAITLNPSVRTVIDIGAQNTRAMRVEPSGRVKAFRMNNRCAAGAGRFLERTAMALEISLDEMGPLSLRSKNPETISSICAVMAESEVINLVSYEARLEDILAGVHRSLVERIVSLVRQVGVEPVVMLTGGVARNVGMVHTLREVLELDLDVSPLAEYCGAIGAAVLGWTRVRRKGWIFMDKMLRPLQLDDIDALVSIEQALGVAADAEQLKEHLKKYLERGEAAFGYEQGGQIVGYILGFIREGEFGLGGRSGWIERISVHPKFQHVGIGRLLMHTLLSYFSEAGVQRVITLVDSDRRDMLRFFRRHQFQEVPLICLDRDLKAIPVEQPRRREDAGATASQASEHKLHK